jgi:hypothetical protein
MRTCGCPRYAAPPDKYYLVAQLRPIRKKSCGRSTTVNYIVLGSCHNWYSLAGCYVVPCSHSSPRELWTTILFDWATMLCYIVCHSYYGGHSHHGRYGVGTWFEATDSSNFAQWPCQDQIDLGTSSHCYPAEVKREPENLHGFVVGKNTVLNREAQQSDCFMDIWANSKEHFSVQIVFWIRLVSSAWHNLPLGEKLSSARERGNSFWTPKYAQIT